MSGTRSSVAPVVEAGEHTPGLMPRHQHRVLPVHELIVVQSGMLPIAEDDRRFAVQEHEWVLLHADRNHYGYQDLHHDTWFYWVCFGPPPADESGIESAVLRGCQTGPVRRPDRLRTLFENLLEDQQAGILKPSTSRCYLQLIMAEILLDPAAPAVQSAGNQLARRAAVFISNYLTDPHLSTARIADAIACNPDYLGRAFRAAFNETPTDHIHRLRIDRARVLFRSTNQSIKRVGAEVGFSDERYFRRIFRRRVGLTPGQFQRLRAPRAEKTADR